MIQLDWQTLVIGLAVIIYTAYHIGKFREQERERKRKELHLAADNAKDPEERKRLLLKWNELTDNRILRKAFKANLEAGSRRKVNPV